MTDALWTRLAEIVPDALERPPAGRDAFLDAACATDGVLDAALRAEAAALVAAAAREDATGALQPPLAGLAGALAQDIAPAPPPDRLGPWRLRGLLGEGGQGTVYRAARADGAFDREVALKLIRGGPTHARRLDAERRVLARLEHDGIARLYDGGTVPDGLAAGAPYLVMELVDGAPLDRAARGRPLPERIELMLQVCDAVAYAHRHLVVHRDLKPSNVLVTPDGRAKLLDFGIAHLLDGDALTRTGERALTPAYAAPEQLLREPITTATDVYALGVLLYQVLAGARPYDLSALTASAAERVVCHETPPPPSAAASADARALRGDLDTVVMTALDKDPARRYASAEALAADLRRARDGRPIVARPATAAHRARLFARRHRAAVAAAAAGLAALVGGLGLAVWQGREAAAARDRAEARFEVAHDAARALLFEVHDAVEALDGSTAARELVLARSIDYLDRLAEGAGDDLALRADLGEAYYKVGYVQGVPTGTSLGRTRDARESFRRGLAVLPPPRRPAPTDTTALRVERVRGRLLEKYGTVLAYQGEMPEALARLDSAVAVLHAAAAAAPLYDDLATLEAGALVNRGDYAGHPHFPNDGRPDDALADYRAARAVLDAIPAPARQLYTERLWGITFEREGTLLAERGDLAGARAAYERAIALRRRIVLRDDANPAARRDLAVSYETLGRLLRDEGRPGEALPYLVRAQTAFAGFAEDDPADVDAQLSLALVQIHVARSLGGADGANLGRQTESRATFDGAVGRLRRLAARDPDNAHLREILQQTVAERQALG